MDALEVHQPGVPELKLDSGQGVQRIQQGLGRVFAQHIPDLVGPVDDDGLDGVQQRVVQGGGDPAGQRREERLSARRDPAPMLGVARDASAPKKEDEEGQLWNEIHVHDGSSSSSDWGHHGACAGGLEDLPCDKPCRSGRPLMGVREHTVTATCFKRRTHQAVANGAQAGARRHLGVLMLLWATGMPQPRFRSPASTC